MHSPIVETVGFLAAATTAATFYCQRMVWLRGFAIAANVLFITYGAAMLLMPVLLLHCFLLPLNILRLRDALVKRRAGASHRPGETSGAVFLADVRGGPVVRG